MILIWFSAGILLGMINLYSQWWVIQRLHPHPSLGAPVRLALSSSIIRFTLIAILLYLAIQHNILYAILLLAGSLIARWMGLIFINMRN